MKELIGDECYISLDSDNYVLFYFTASWCGPCQRILPDLIDLEKKIKSQIDVYKIDIDEDDNNELCEKCIVKSVPSFLLFKKRNCIDRVHGAKIEPLEKMILNVLEKENKNKDS